MAELAGQGQSQSKSWSDALSVYRHPRVIVMLFLGFSAGLPLLLIFGTLSAWLRQEDVSRTTIGFFSWVGLLFSFKFVWAPVVDRIAIPGLTAMMGKRRSWMLLLQTAQRHGAVDGILIPRQHRHHALTIATRNDASSRRWQRAHPE